MYGWLKLSWRASIFPWHALPPSLLRSIVTILNQTGEIGTLVGSEH